MISQTREAQKNLKKHPSDKRTKVPHFVRTSYLTLRLPLRERKSKVQKRKYPIMRFWRAWLHIIQKAPPRVEKMIYMGAGDSHTISR